MKLFGFENIIKKLKTANKKADEEAQHKQREERRIKDLEWRAEKHND